MISNKETLIERLAFEAHASYGIKLSNAKRIASAYVNDKGNKLINDPLANHGSIDPYVEKMLLNCGVYNKKQLKKLSA